ncbi:reverse transcriptase [Gossypium australe]|uniref:Reverse transcriptase n=1 Tax=Gossypium australe TaxID=47621 RepID=A0A5B6VY87_9ROSI|nr:reverse transcriptase [Gossypium australe]
MKLREGELGGVKVSRRGPKISHLLFVDDCIISGEASDRGANVLKRLFQEYEEVSGNSANLTCSCFYKPEKSIWGFLIWLVGRTKRPFNYSRIERNVKLIVGAPGFYLKEAIPTYMMAFFKLSISLCNEMEGIIVKF